HHAKITQVDGEFFADRARKSASIGIETAQLATFDLDNVGGADPLCIFISDVNHIERRNFMRNGEIHADELEFADEIDRTAQLVRRNLKTRILHIDLAMLKRSILHLRRERVLHRIAENSEPDRRIDVAPIFSIACPLRSWQKLF